MNSEFTVAIKFPIWHKKKMHEQEGEKVKKGEEKLQVAWDHKKVKELLQLHYQPYRRHG